jgi:hypothetical protein
MRKLSILGIERDVHSPLKARQLGYKPFTYAYEPNTEAWMIDRLAADLDRARTDWVIVYVPDPHAKSHDYIEIWKRSYSKHV